MFVGVALRVPGDPTHSFIAGASAGCGGAGRLRRGSGSANELGALAHVMEPAPVSWMDPADRHVAASAVTVRTPPPLRLTPMPPHPASLPSEFAWTLPAEVT